MERSRSRHLDAFEIYHTTRDSAEAMVRKVDEAAVLVFHKGFGDSMNAGKSLPIEFEYDAAKEAEVGILQSALIGNLMNIAGSKSMASNAISKFDLENPTMNPSSREAIHKQIESNFSSDESKEQTASFIKSTPLIAQKENLPGLIHAVAGTSIMMLLFSVVGMGPVYWMKRNKGL